MDDPTLVAAVLLHGRRGPAGAGALEAVRGGRDWLHGGTVGGRRRGYRPLFSGGCVTSITRGRFEAQQRAVSPAGGGTHAGRGQSAEGHPQGEEAFHAYLSWQGSKAC